MGYRITDKKEVERLIQKGRIRQSERELALSAFKTQSKEKSRSSKVTPELSLYPPQNGAMDDPARYLCHLMTREFGCFYCGGLVVLELACIPNKGYRADIALPNYMITIEIEGWQYHSKKKSFQRDRERKLHFFSHGWRVLDVTNKLIKTEPELIIEGVRKCMSKIKPRSNFEITRKSYTTNLMIDYDK